MKEQISGIQQVGVGIPDVMEAWKWYRKNFGVDIPILNEAAVADKMLPYTGGEPHERHAVLAINLMGGGGMEIWQYTDRTPVGPGFQVQLGDLGINIAKIKTPNPKAAMNAMQEQDASILSSIHYDPQGREYFLVEDPYGNWFQVMEYQDWYKEGKYHTGGPFGVAIGVSDIEKSLTLYRDLLGYDEVLYDEEGTFDEFSSIVGGHLPFRRVLLTHSQPRKGPFSKLLGKSEIELIQVKDRKPNKIFENRLWGDLGFIHLCFDVIDMPTVKAACEANGFPFTCDSNPGFDMGDAAGHFSYIEDPDGTLIEFVETYKIPIIKKINWSLDLKKRNREEALPDYILKALKFARVKD